jgi:NADH:ubiquinone oxidoreductase subunit E
MSRRHVRPVPAAVLEEVRSLVGEAPRRDLLIECLHRIQDAHGHLDAERLAALAQLMKLARAEVYEVATFYHHFDVVRAGEAPPPPLTVRVCDSLACAMAGAEQLIAEISQSLGDGVRVQRVPCVGRCECAPVAVVGQNPVEEADVHAVRYAIDAGAIEAPLPEGARRMNDYRAAGGYRLYADCVAGRRSAEEIIAALEHANLRGLGGAGFPAGRKWRVVRDQPAPRLMAVNIDEGEPGTFKDRFYLEREPHRFLEGMLIAAWAVGIEKIYIYLRDEYAGLRALLAEELDALRAAFPQAPEIELRRGAGAYVCGEESAMIESIEGKRGQPRLRPPFVAEVGSLRPADPRAQHGDAVLGARDRRARRGVVRRAGPPRPQGAALVLGERARGEAGRASGAGRHHAARTHRRILRGHAARP